MQTTAHASVHVSPPTSCAGSLCSSNCENLLRSIKSGEAEFFIGTALWLLQAVTSNAACVVLFTASCPTHTYSAPGTSMCHGIMLLVESLLEGGVCYAMRISAGVWLCGCVITAAGPYGCGAVGSTGAQKCQPGCASCRVQAGEQHQTLIITVKPQLGQLTPHMQSKE